MCLCWDVIWVVSNWTSMSQSICYFSLCLKLLYMLLEAHLWRSTNQVFSLWWTWKCTSQTMFIEWRFESDFSLRVIHIVQMSTLVHRSINCLFLSILSFPGSIWQQRSHHYLFFIIWKCLVFIRLWNCLLKLISKVNCVLPSFNTLCHFRCILKIVSWLSRLRTSLWSKMILVFLSHRWSVYLFASSASTAWSLS